MILKTSYVVVHHVAEAGDDEVVDDVEAETGAGHVGGEAACAVKFGLEPAHHSQTHQPAIEAVERVGKVMRGGVVLTKGGRR